MDEKITPGRVEECPRLLTTPVRRVFPLSIRAGFVAASCGLVGVFLSSGTPVPLYNTYRAEDGITNGGLALTTVVYLVVTALALLVLGRLSDHLGRKPVAIAAVSSSLAGCLVLLNVHSLPMLITGRALQGLACGVASAGLGSYVIDSAPAQPRWLAAMITSSVPQFAIPVGAILCGMFAKYLPAPRVLIYEFVSGLLAVCILFLALSPETVHRRAGALTSLRPRVHVAPGTTRLMFAAGAGVLATWSLGGFFQAFAPSIAADHLGTSSPVAVAAVFASIMILSPLGAGFSGRIRPSVALQAGLVVFTLMSVVIVSALIAGSMAPFLAASLVAGAAMGVAGMGGMRAVLAGAGPGDRAGILATIYLVSYTGAAVPGLIAGRLTTVFDLEHIAIGYVALILIASIVAITLVGFPAEMPKDSVNVN